jgi:hypothetical protein
MNKMNKTHLGSGGTAQDNSSNKGDTDGTINYKNNKNTGHDRVNKLLPHI